MRRWIITKSRTLWARTQAKICRSEKNDCQSKKIASRKVILDEAGKRWCYKGDEKVFLKGKKLVLGKDLNREVEVG